MKYLKLYENFIQPDSEIHKLCKKYGIKNYTINNGLVDVDGNVDLSSKKLSKLPIKFGVIIGYFSCYDNQLTSLEGAPQEVSGDFYCHNNKLTTLEGAPQKVGNSFYCYNNKLTSLVGAPEKVGKLFNCGNNQLTSLDGAPKFIGSTFYCNDNKLTSLKGGPQEVSGNFYCSGNKLTSLEGGPQEVGGSFNCSVNKLTSLVGGPKEVGGSFNCSVNNIYRLDFIPNYKGALYISKTPFYKIWKLIEDSIEKDYTLFDHFIENNIFRDPGYQGDNSGLPIIILDRLNDFLDMCKIPNVEEIEGYTCI